MSDSPHARRPPSPVLPAWVAAVLDAAVIILFAAIGRASHSEASPVLESLSVAWPFLVGAAVGWLIALGPLGRSPGTVAGGIPIWLSAVILGMALRALTHRGIAFSFIIVATIVLAAFLFGWRAASFWLRRHAQ